MIKEIKAGESVKLKDGTDLIVGDRCQLEVVERFKRDLTKFDTIFTGTERGKYNFAYRSYRGSDQGWAIQQRGVDILWRENNLFRVDDCASILDDYFRHYPENSASYNPLCNFGRVSLEESMRMYHQLDDLLNKVGINKDKDIERRWKEREEELNRDPMSWVLVAHLLDGLGLIKR